MFQFDHSPDFPDSSLLTEIGIDARTVRETIEDDRMIRCPEHPAAYPERGFAGLIPDPAADQRRRRAWRG